MIINIVCSVNCSFLATQPRVCALAPEIIRDWQGDVAILGNGKRPLPQPKSFRAKLILFGEACVCVCRCLASLITLPLDWPALDPLNEAIRRRALMSMVGRLSQRQPRWALHWCGLRNRDVLRAPSPMIFNRSGTISSGIFVRQLVNLLMFTT